MKATQFALAAVIVTAPAAAEVLYLQPDGTAATADGQTPLSAEGRKAGSLFEVRSIAVDGSACEASISEEIRGEGILVASRESADAQLNVSVVHDGEDGTYSATLVGNAGKILFSTAGDEGAGNLAALCEEIGEEIADSLEDRLG